MTPLPCYSLNLQRFFGQPGLSEAFFTHRKPGRTIFLDTPPAAGSATTVAAYAAADWFLLSTFPHPLSLGGLNEALKDIAEVRGRCNPKLEILGVILSCVDSRTKLLVAQLEELLAHELPGRTFRTRITQANAVPAVSGSGRTLFDTLPYADHKVAHQYRSLVVEIEERVLNREAFLTYAPRALAEIGPGMPAMGVETVNG
jgi:cellulose biosynthesis protein BcsQ